MELPPFPEKRSKGRIKGIKVNKQEREGEILFDHKKRGFYIKKSDEIFGYYDSMTEAFYYKKILMENDWDASSIKKKITQRIPINKKLNLDKNYKVKLNYCPNCRSKLKIDEKECSSCGINIEEYLYSK